MKLSSRILSIAAGVLGMTLSAASYGSTISFTDVKPLASTDWTRSVTVPRFDPAWGTLNSISFTLRSHVVSDVEFESDGPSPATITTSVNATMILTRPDMTAITQTNPLISSTDNVTAYDNVFDFGGTSGRTYLGLFADDSVAITSSSASDLALFTGGGNITLPVSAELVASASGSGNLTTQFTSRASAIVTVTYDFVPGVPVPAATWSGITLLAGMVAARIRRGLGA